MAVTRFKLDPVAHGREDCDDAVINGADAAEMARDPLGADEALINAMNRSWVMDAAGADPRADQDEEWARVGLPWCRAYNEAFRARAEESAAASGCVRRQMSNYSIDDGHCNQITTGLQGYDAALAVARRIANSRGESVWLYQDSDGAQAYESEEIAPGEP